MNSIIFRSVLMLALLIGGLWFTHPQAYALTEPTVFAGQIFTDDEGELRGGVMTEANGDAVLPTTFARTGDMDAVWLLVEAFGLLVVVVGLMGRLLKA